MRNTIKSQEIKAKQNEVEYLKVQYAARFCYNTAEHLNNWVWLLCVISAAFIFLPDDIPIWINIFPFLAEIIAAILSFVLSKYISDAAFLRKFFDSKVLGINEMQFSTEEERYIKEKYKKIYRLHKKEADVQIANTGRDNPPGVKNWYEFSSDIDGLKAVFKCQYQNVWWNKKMIKGRLCVLLILFFLIVAIYIIFAKTRGAFQVLLCSAGIIIKFAERVIEICRYQKVSIEIDAVLLLVEKDIRMSLVESLQELIDKRRTIEVLEINLFHKKKAKALSEEYEDISG